MLIERLALAVTDDEETDEEWVIGVTAERRGGRGKEGDRAPTIAAGYETITCTYHKAQRIETDWLSC